MARSLPLIEKDLEDARQKLATVTKQVEDAEAFVRERRALAGTAVTGFVFLNAANQQEFILNSRLRPEKQRLQNLIIQLEAERNRAQADAERRQREREEQRRAQLERHLTRGNLVPASLYPVTREGVPKPSALRTLTQPVYFHFNPSDYTIQKKVKYSDKGLNEAKNYNLEYDSNVEPRTLTINSIWFDTSETGKDVSEEIDKLMQYAEQDTMGASLQTVLAVAKPTYAAFAWGTFRFLCVVESITAEFTHFKPDGTPLRAKVSLTLKEFKHRKLYANQNPTSGGRPEVQTWEINAGDRLDSIAARVYGDATQWRLIAQVNNILDPFHLQPGRTLIIPAQWG